MASGPLSANAPDSPFTNPLVAEKPGQGRIDMLDGLRGLAALLVVIYHYTSRWTEAENGESIYPHGDGIAEALPFLNSFGGFGIFLFFLISGFVIFMTLSRTSGLVDFAVRRGARLWPTMIVCAVLTTIAIQTSGIHARFDSLAYWEIQPLEFVSSVFFVDPGFISQIFGIPGLDWVDGVYWTLWVEVRFYLLIALVYWIAGGRLFLLAWCLVQLISAAILVVKFERGLGAVWVPELIFQSSYLAWFSLGIAAYQFWNRQALQAAGWLAAISLGTLAIEASYSLLRDPGGNMLERPLLYGAVIGTFWLCFAWPAFRSILRTRWAVTLGLASYPLYMFHERIGVIAMTILDDLGLPVWLIPFLVLAGVIATALLIHRYIERPAQRFILARLIPSAARLQQRWALIRFRMEKASPD